MVTDSPSHVQSTRDDTAPVPRYSGSRWSALRQVRADRAGFLLRLRREHGPVVRFPLGPFTAFLVSDPDLIQRVLVTANHDYPKGFGRLGTKPGRQPLSRMLGEGLLTSQGDFHRHQRRLIQPVFHRQRIAAYGDVFASLSDEVSSRWTDGGALDVHQQMTDLTFAIVNRTLFDLDPGDELSEVVLRAVEIGLRSSPVGQLPFARLLEKLPVPSTRRWQRAREDLFGVVHGLITERRRGGTDLAERSDLLSLLLAARDADTGAPMDDAQVRDEALTIMTAGHETTANALTWTWHLLADHPEVEAALHAEVDALLPDRLPTAADLPRLSYTDRVLTESMRLYPPAWLMARRPLADQRLGPYRIPAGGMLLMSPYVVHRDPDLYPEPERFDPDRWLAERVAERHRFAYLPFGAGPRKCIGDGFARMEGVLALATIARKWRFQLPPGAAPVRTEPLITLRPRGGLPLVATRRR